MDDGHEVQVSRLHGKDCSYNPSAFPPSVEVDAEERPAEILAMQDAYMEIGG